MKIAIPIKAIGWFVVCAVLLSACGLKLVYNRLDWVLPFYVDDYVTLDEDQQIELHNKITSLMSWHRTTQLNAYSTMLRKARKDVVNGLSEDTIKEFFTGFDEGFRTVMVSAAPHIVDMLIGANDEQKKELFQNLKSLNQDYKEKYIDLSDEEKLENIIEAMQDNFSDWLGDLTDKQNQIIADYAEKLLPVDRDRYQYRLQWQGMLKQSFLSNKPVEQMRPELIRLFAHSNQFYPKQYQTKLDANRLVLQQMLMVLNVEITKEQFQYLGEKLEYYAASFEDLSKQKG